MTSQLQLAAKMTEVRDALRGMFGADWPDRIEKWKTAVRVLARQLDCRLIEVVPRFSEAERAAGRELSAIETAWLTAATVEAIEEGDQP